MSSTPEYSWVLIQHWQLTFALAAAVVYCVGYLRSSLLLRTLRVDLPPTEIYGSTSLFVSGLTGTVAALLVPSIAAVASILVVEAGVESTLTLRVGIITAVFLLMFAALPKVERFGPPGFQIFPIPRYAWKGAWLRVLSSLSIALASVVGFMGQETRAILFVSAFVLWLACLLWTHLVTARDISAGMAIGATTHDPVMLGHLITRGRIAPIGTTISDYGSEAFQTGGLLLGRRDGVLYFLPGTYAVEDGRDFPPSWRLALIPDAQVITFLHDPGS